jgi:Mat/Ecp fimbriae outer membrane usher protein
MLIKQINTLTVSLLWRILILTTFGVASMAVAQAAEDFKDGNRITEGKGLLTEMRYQVEELSEQELLIRLGVIGDVVAEYSGSDEQVAVTSSRAHKNTNEQAWVPPGFEELLQPQSTEIDIYYGDFFLIAVVSNFNDDEITFTDPDAITNRIPDLLNPELVSAYLKSPLSTNRKLICRKRTQVDCGRLDMGTDEIGVIFDDSLFRADLFIGQDLLKVRGREDNKYLPRSDAGLSYLQNITANINGTDTGVGSYNVVNSMFLAHREKSINLISNFINDAGVQIDTLSLSRELDGANAELGIFYGKTNNLSFIKDTQFLGASFGSSVATRQNLDKATGTDIQVFISSRSRVDIFREGRLINTKYYNIGNQSLDTSRLPNGSYDIDIEITDSGGKLTKETRFFSKTGRLPPLGELLYFAQAGQKVRRSGESILPEAEDNGLFLRAGVSKRITDNFGGTIASTFNDQHFLLESMLFKQAEYYEVMTNLAYESTGNYGLSVRARMNYLGLVFSQNYRKIWSKPGATQMGSQFGPSSMSVSSNLGIRTRYGTWNLFGRYNDSNSRSRKNYGFRWNLGPSAIFSGSLPLNLEVSKDNDDKLIYLSTSYQFSSGAWSTNVRPLIEYEDTPEVKTTKYLGSLRSTWKAENKPEKDLKLSLRADRNRSSDKLEANLNAQSDKGTLNAGIGYQTDSQDFDFLGNISTNISATTSNIYFGGSQSSSAGFIVKVNGEKQDDSFFDVIVNSRVVGRTRAGEPVFIALSPFNTYYIDVLPTGGAMIALAGSKQKKTLYPGNVIDLEWEAMEFLILFGRVIDNKGKTIPNALVKNIKSLALTDEDGYLQAEVSTKLKELIIQKGQKICTITLPVLNPENKIVFLEDLVCI